MGKLKYVKIIRNMYSVSLLTNSSAEYRQYTRGFISFIIFIIYLLLIYLLARLER